MRFWDASALVPLCCTQPATARVEQLARDDAAMVVWWATPVEVASAFGRLRGEGRLSSDDLLQTGSVLDALRGSWSEILPSDVVRERAERLIRAHPLRAADALQLAAALIWVSDRPGGEVMVTLDDRLGEAARQEGFVVQP